MEPLSELTDAAYRTAVDAACSASGVIMPFWPNPLNPRFDPSLALKVFEKEGTGNYATVADLESEKKIIGVITSRPSFKNHSILSEESDEIQTDMEWRWIIDPIDGTPNFRNGNPDFGICIALFHGREPVIGLIAMPALGQIAVAKRGDDAKLIAFDGTEIANLRTLASKYSDPLERALVGYDLGYSGRKEQLREITERVISHVGYASCLASFSTGNFRLLQGMMGIYFGMSPTIMDVAPAAALIPAAGGVVSDMNGKAIDWGAEKRSYVGAVNPEIHRRFLELVNR